MKNKIINIYLLVLSKYLYLHNLFFTWLDNKQLAVWHRIISHVTEIINNNDTRFSEDCEDYDSFDNVE